MSNLDAKIIIDQISAWARQLQLEPGKQQQGLSENLQLYYDYFEAYLAHFRKMKEKKKEIDAKQALNRSYKKQLDDCKTLLLEQYNNIDNLLPHPVEEKSNIFFQDPDNKNYTSKRIIEYAKTISTTLQAIRNFVPSPTTPAKFLSSQVDQFQIRESYINFISRADGEVSQKCLLPQYELGNPTSVISRKGNVIEMMTSAQFRIADQGRKYFYKWTTDGTIPSPYIGEMVTPQDIKIIDRDTNVKIIAFKDDYTESDILELSFIIKHEEFKNNGDYAERPEFELVRKDATIDTLGTPMSVLDTPHSLNTPLQTPTMNREISQPKKRP